MRTQTAQHPGVLALPVVFFQGHLQDEENMRVICRKPRSSRTVVECFVWHYVNNLSVGEDRRSGHVEQVGLLHPRKI